MNLSRILLMFLFLSFFSCSDEKMNDPENFSNTENLENADFDFDFKLGEDAFTSKYDLGYKDEDKLENFIDKLSKVAFSDNALKYDVIFHVSIKENTTLLKTSELREKSNAESCPEGYDNLGVCHSDSCVQEAITNYFADHREELANGAEISIRLVPAWGGRRVCGNVSFPE